MLKVRFANVDHSASRDLGVDFFNNSFNQQSTLGTGGLISKDGNTFDLASAVNILLFRKDINLVAAIRALESKRQFEMLAEPNLLTLSGQPASFLAGGEFPFPVVQPGGSGGAAISIMWREFGIRLNFLPEVTPRGTIRMKVAPEVSSLDYTNSVSVLGQTIPGISSRRVQTDVELDSGQSFVIAGLLDRHTSENMAKVPGIGSLPIIGKLFQSKLVSRANSELLVIITPELVRPIPVGDPVPALKYQDERLNTPDTAQVSQPSSNKLGPAPARPPAGSLPVEQLIQKQGQPQQQTAPMMPSSPTAPATPGTGTPQAAAPVAGSGGAR
jgi:pilus assembly protein CpaC